jgi:protein O-GlcNAc transferase
MTDNAKSTAAMAKLTCEQALQRATVLMDNGQITQAHAVYKAVLTAFPDNTPAREALSRLDQLDKSKSAISNQTPPQDRLAALAALYNQGRMETVVEQVETLTREFPKSFVLWNVSGAANAQLGRLEHAITAFRNARDLNPNYAAAHNNLGIALKKQGKLGAAIQSYRQALVLEPDSAEGHNNLGIALQEQGKLDEAIESYKQALLIRPDFAHAEAQLLHQRQHICDWADFSELPAVCARLGITSGALPPFLALPMEDSPQRQEIRSQKFAREQFEHTVTAPFTRARVKSDRVRIGYFSADFNNHATLLLISGMLREHDKTKFEIFAYGFGNVQADGLSERVQRKVDVFTDVTAFSDKAIVTLARKHKLDIAIDLKGYTAQARTGIFACRLAPIQINFLGYPGTMGAEFIDYIIADPTVIPEDQRQYYNEACIYLPHCYLPTDNQQVLATASTARVDYGLPETAFIFCCFNNNYKISPREFDIWMRVLSRVDGSYLWLLRSNRWTEQNLRSEAVKRGIDPDRLVFAEKAPYQDHLERHRHADLFLDTFNYNAHTTATDALWAGLPVVTKAGNQFAARVSASLLKAVGVPELITWREQDYEALVLHLANHPEQLAEIRNRLHRNRLAEPLFDSKKYTRDFESGLRRVYNLYLYGRSPQDIWV